jgi:hypothetical protein
MSVPNGFRMFEKAPYDQSDPKASTELVMRGAKDVEKVYGPAFTAEVIKNALRAVATKTGEESPKDIKTLNQLTDYLVSKSEKLQAPPHFLAHWAVYVTEKRLEGSLGAGYQMATRGQATKVMESDGNEKLSDMDIDQVMSKLRKLAVDMKIAPVEFGYKKNKDGSIDVFHGGCSYLEGCRLSQNETLLHRPDGRISCGNSAFVCQFLKSSTGYEWDHTVLEFGKPYCITRLSII